MKSNRCNQKVSSTMQNIWILCTLVLALVV